MKRVSYFPLLLVALFLLSCGKVADPDARELELSYLRCVMPESLLEFAHVEVPARENIAIQSAGSDQHLGLHLFAGQKKLNRGIRAEISVDYPHQPGDTIHYAWRFMVPKGFQSDSPHNRWWIVGQWHDQPNRDRVENWDGFPSRSPPVLLGIGELDDRLAISMAYGPDQSQKRGPLFIEPGQWHSLAVEIRWSLNADGRAALFLDDMSQPAAVIDGPNMHNDFQHYLKFGMYRHPEIATDNWIYLDDLTITTRIAK
ncbi:MAG: polysaccharide lyase [Pirellulaceae bacterium]|jgi:hypothetical protein|nr:polysaccharide lyase [Pirellulaceae bacterium]